MMLTHRRIVDRIRVEQATAGRESAYGRLQAGRDHDEVLGSVEEREVLHGLGTLPPLQRESIVLAYYGGLTYSQGAARLGTPLPTVKGRFREGLERLAAGPAEAERQVSGRSGGHRIPVTPATTDVMLSRCTSELAQALSCQGR
jgi:RNA polymerase sigma-70 factor, ECF subfamily